MNSKSFLVGLLVLLILLSGCRPFKGTRDDDPLGRDVPEDTSDVVDLSWIDDLTVRDDASTTLDMPIIGQLDLPSNTKLSNDQLIKLASNYAAIGVRSPDLTKEQLALMKSVNPDMIILKYMGFASGYRVVSNSFLNDHPDMLLKTESGEIHRGLLNLKDNELVIDPGNTLWKDTLVSAAKKAVIDGGYDGIMADQTVMVNHLYEGFTGINPRTEKPYTTETWRDDMYILLGIVKEVIGEDKLLIANSIRDGPGYFEEGAERFLEVTDGFIAEGFKGPISWSTSRYPNEEDWVQDIEMLRGIQDDGGYIVGIAKYDAYNVGSQDELDQQALFWFTTFMLGKGDTGGYRYWVFDKKNPYASESTYFDYYLAPIGSPLGSYYKKEVYQRDFENGKILVNPTTNSITVSLGVGYGTLEGTMVDDITLDAHSGVILLKFK